MTRPFALRPFLPRLCAVVLGLTVAIAVAADPPPKGQRVFTAGHSFHVFMPAILTEMAKSAGIEDHKQVGVSSIGGSRVIQHWDKAEEKNTAIQDHDSPCTRFRGSRVDVRTAILQKGQPERSPVRRVVGWMSRLVPRSRADWPLWDL